MRYQKSFAIAMIFFGMLFCADSRAITGYVISNSVNQSAGNLIGLILIIGGALFFLKSEALEKMINPKSVVQYGKLKEFLRFWEATGISPYKKSAWIERYHAFPKGKFKGEYLNPKLSREGFYMASTPEEAKEQVELRSGGIDKRLLDVKKIKIAKNVYGGIVKTAYTGLGEADFIPPKKINQANKLIRKGFIKIK